VPLDWCSYYRDTLDDPSCYHLCRLKLAWAKTSRFTNFIMMLLFLRTKPSPTIFLPLMYATGLSLTIIQSIKSSLISIIVRYKCARFIQPRMSPSPHQVNSLPSRMRALIFTLLLLRPLHSRTQHHQHPHEEDLHEQSLHMVAQT
jgi:hypothetical protein